MTRTLSLILSLALLVGWSSAAWAQLTVAPEEILASVAQGETATQTVTLTNTGSEPLSFCLSFDRPLQRTDGSARISDDALGGAPGAACGPYGEVLAVIGRGDVPTEVSWNPYGLAMTPDGRLFAADLSRGSFGRTVELTPELEYVRQFPFPREYELDFSPFTNGVTYNVDTGTLWWLNVEDAVVNNEVVTLRALLLEGDLDGVPAGRRIELPIGDDLPPDERAKPVGLSYDPTRQRYYYTDIRSDVICAVDTLGNPVEGYPVAMEGYSGATLGRGLNALFDTSGEDTSGGGEALRFELYVNPPGPAPRRLGVVGRHGEDTAPEAEPLETPLVESLPGIDEGDINGEAVRSVLDPNGVLYYPWSGFEDSGVVAIRPHPLPPSWLVVEAWDGTLAPGESTEIELTFRPGGRALGEYTAVLQAFEAETGAAVEVPLSMTVTQGTDAEDDAAAPDASSLTVYPNPLGGSAATVALALDAAADVRVTVYDVLGRQVAALHRGELAAGRHEIALDGRTLPAGVYLVKAEVGARRFVERITLVR